MKAFDKIFLAAAVFLMGAFLFVNLWFWRQSSTGGSRPYLVEIERLALALEKQSGEARTASEQSAEGRDAAGEVPGEQTLEGQDAVEQKSYTQIWKEETFYDEEALAGLLPDGENCKYVKRIFLCEDVSQLIAPSVYDYCIRSVDGKLYRFEYLPDSGGNKTGIIIINSILLVVSILLLGMLLFVRRKILLPFQRLENIPYELSRGNLAVAVDEEKGRFLGKFIWGINILRENLEQKHQEELAVQKEKKMLLLSLAHDIKTPLSVIQLNAQALEKGLYPGKEKQREAAEAINRKTAEIDSYLAEITKASREDFLKLEVKTGEVYLSEIIHRLREYYDGKLGLKKIGFRIDEYMDCILEADGDRLAEVLQNLMENAVKYGDGGFIRIRFGREDDCQLITVESSGATLKPEELPKVFDSFYRGSNAGGEQGSGLGLYICRQLMNKMNGDIFVKENATCFLATVVVRMK